MALLQIGHDDVVDRRVVAIQLLGNLPYGDAMYLVLVYDFDTLIMLEEWVVHLSLLSAQVFGLLVMNFLNCFEDGRHLIFLDGERSLNLSLVLRGWFGIIIGTIFQIIFGLAKLCGVFIR